MDSWEKFGLRIIRHPRFKKLKQHCFNALLFVELSCRYNDELTGELGKGVVILRDDEIAGDYNISMDAWYDLRAAMLEQSVCRERRLPDGRKAYEIAFWVLPDQTSINAANPGYNVRDGRDKNIPWPLLPSLAMEEEEESAGSRGDTQAEKKPGAYRTSKSTRRARWRNEYFQAHGFFPSKQEDKAWGLRYDSEHWTGAAASESEGEARTEQTPSENQTPNETAHAPANFGADISPKLADVSPDTLSDVSENVSFRAELEREETEETENNSFQKEAADPDVSRAPDTNIGANANKKTVVVLSPLQKELHEVYGVSPAWAQKWTKQYSEAHIRERMQWVTLEYPGLEKEHTGLLVNYMRDTYSMRGAVVKELNRLASAARKDAQRAASDRQDKARSANLQRQRDARAALWLSLSPQQQDEMRLRAQENFARENPAFVEFAGGDWTRPALRLGAQKIVDALLDTEIMIGDVKAPPGEDHAAAIPPDAAI